MRILKDWIFPTFFIFLSLFLVGLLIGSPYIFGDGYGYYHVGKNIVEYKSFTSESIPEYVNYTGHAVLENNNKYVTPYTLGNGLLWTPFLLIADFFDSGSVTTDYFKAFNGHSLADGLGIQISGILFLSIALVLIYKTLISLKFSKNNSIFSTITIAISSFVLGYSLINASYSHVYEFFIVSLIYFLLISIDSDNKSRINSKTLLLGLSLGLLVLIRPINLILIIPIFIYLVLTQKRKILVLILIPSILMAGLFFLYNYISYGGILKTGYSINSDIGLSLSRFNLAQLLFSDIRGWSFYSPIMIFSIFGLVKLSIKSKIKSLIYMIPVVMLILFYSFWENWWAGDSIGQRFFICLAPICSIGLAYLISKIDGRVNKKILISILTVLALYSLVTFLLYRFTPTAEIGALRNDYPEVTKSEKFSPIDIYSYHFSLISNSKNIQEYFTKLQGGLAGGRSILMIYLGYTQPIAKILNNVDGFIVNIIPDPKLNNSLEGLIFSVSEMGELNYYMIKNVDWTIQQSFFIKCVSSKECSIDGTKSIPNITPASSSETKFLKNRKTLKIPDGLIFTIFEPISVKIK